MDSIAQTPSASSPHPGTLVNADGDFYIIRSTVGSIIDQLKGGFLYIPEQEAISLTLAGQRLNTTTTELAAYVARHHIHSLTPLKPEHYSEG